MTGNYKLFKEKCEFRKTKAECKTSSGCRFRDKCGLYKGNMSCTKANCPLYGGDQSGD